MSREEIVKKLESISDDKIQQIDNYMNSLIKQNEKQEEFKLTNYSELVGSAHDLMGRSFLAKNLAGIIDKDVQPPFVVGIYGKWGSGKTNFLDFLRESIEQEPSGKCLVHYFNAWKYETTGNIMYSLYKSINSLLLIEKSDKRRAILGVARNLSRTATYFLREKVGISILEMFKFNGENKVADWLDENYESVQRIDKEFEATVADVLMSNKKSTLIVMVDDLDRCSPENVVVILESMKNFFSTKNCIFVLAVDKDVVISGIKHKYNGSKFISGDEYLDKIVNFSVELKLEPSVGIKNLIDHYYSNYQSIIKGEKPDFLLTAFETLRCQSVRTAKRILDKYVLLMKTPVAGSIHSRVLLFVLILQEMIPDLYRDLKRISTPNLLDAIIGHSPARDTAPDKLPDTQVLILGYYKRTNILSFISAFKQYYLPQGPESKNERLTPFVLKAIHYIETFTFQA